MLPHARENQLIIQEMGEETVVYDQENDKIHRLNQTAAFIWRRCDGHTSISDLASQLQMETQTPIASDVVWLALDRLSKANLLQSKLVKSDETSFVTRRDVLRKAAIVGGISLLLPVVQSIVAPTPAMAASIGCTGIGQIPNATHPCCVGLNVIRGRCYGHGVG